MQPKANNMATSAKTQKQNKNIVPKSTRRKLILAHHQLYRAFFLKGLLSGMTMGAASYNAFQLIKSKLSTMDQNNPVTKFLIRLTARKSKRMAKRIMPSKQRDAQIVLVPEQRAKLEVKIPHWTTKSLNIINTIVTQFQSKKQTVAKITNMELPTITQHKKQLLGVFSLIRQAQLVRARTK